MEAGIGNELPIPAEREAAHRKADQRIGAEGENDHEGDRPQHEEQEGCEDDAPDHDCAPAERRIMRPPRPAMSAMSARQAKRRPKESRSEEHTSELQSLRHLVCRLLLEKKKTKK